MGRIGRSLVALTVVLLGCSWGGASASAQAPQPAGGEGRSVLVFSKTAAFRHGSIPAGVQAVRELGVEHGFGVDVTEDAGAFTGENLAKYDAVVWLSTTGDVLDDAQQAAFEDYIEAGGGYAGVHAASDTEYTWSWYGGLVGAYFNGHPANQTATVDVADQAHQSTSHLPERWERFDEWYNFQTNPRGKVHVLASLDESTYSGGGMGADHPIAWCHYYRGGRSWYTGMGHTNESFQEPAFRQHLAGGILWAAGAVANDCGGTVWNTFQKTVLDDNVASPMGLEVAPDGRVIYIERAGQVRVIDPVTSTSKTALSMPVHDAQENGLLGIALDPDFAQNGWVYLYYSPPSDTIPSPRQHLSRFTMTGDTIDPASEKVILEVPHQRDVCCHSGGYLQFGPDGNLWISIGDDTSPGASDGFTPIDEREGRSAYDAQRTSANTNDLRGKLLRITPTDDGGYTIPAGNLFGPGQIGTRPEIYAMGFRNPFRFTVDQETGWVYLADYGPDAGAGNPLRGTDGRVEWNLIKEPGNYGWPYCHGGAPFIDYDFATSQSGQAFDCQKPVNTSPNNTGLIELPPAVEPTLWYGRGTAHPELGRGGAPMAGPRYSFDPDIESDRQWPAYYDGSAIFYEWGQNKFYEFHLTGDGALYDTTPLLTTMPVNRPHEMKFGRHDGAMYLIEWGSGFGGNNADAQVVRVDYSGGQVNPVAKVGATPISGARPLTVSFSSAGTSHPQGGALTYSWNFGDGTTSDELHPTHTYTEEGNYTAVLTVVDAQGRTGTANVTISVGNTEPDVTIEWPVRGGVFAYGDEIDYKVRVDDVEDGSTATGGIDCGSVVVELILGHDDHGHPMQQQSGCEGSFVAEADGGHTDTDRITYVLEARYTDRGSPDGKVAPMRGSDLSVLQPKRKQAEHHDPDGNIRKEATADPLGGDQNVGFLQNGMALNFSDVNLVNIDALRFRVASPNSTSRIEVRKDSKTGPLLGVANVASTGGFQNWNWAEAPVTDPGETFDMFLVFRGASGFLLNLNWFDFVGAGVAGGPPLAVAPPEASTEPAAPNGAAGWYTSPVDVTLASTADREYRVNFGAWTAYAEPVRFGTDGRYRVDYRARVGEQATAARTLDLAVDTTKPRTTAALEGLTSGATFTGAVRAELAAGDATSGVAQIQWRFAGESGHKVYSGPLTLERRDGAQTLEFRAVDVAGNVEDWQSVTFRSPSGDKPQVAIASPPSGGVVPASGMVPYRVEVTGREGVDCEGVTVRVLVDHNGHTHEAGSDTGCAGDIKTTLPAGHGVDDVRNWVLHAVYTADSGGAGTVSLIRGEAQRTLQPARKQAEHYDTDPSVRTETTRDTLGGGLNVGFIRNGFSLAYSNVNLSGIDAMRFRLASSSIGGTLEVRKGSTTGELLGSVAITNTGGNQSYRWFETPVADPGETFKMYLVFRATGTHFIANFNFFEFVGDGIVTNAPPVIDGLGLSDSSPKTNDTIRALVTAGDADGHAVDLAYRWLRNGEPIDGATAATLDLSVAGNGDKGDELTVEVTPGDPYGPGEPRTSAAATVANSAPTVTDVTADPSTVAEGSPVAFDGTVEDADGDPLTYRWAFGDGSSTDAGPAAVRRYADGPGEHTATLTVTDTDGAGDSRDVAVRVDNVAPAVTAPEDTRARAGEATDFALGSFDDPGADSPWSVTVDWGDGSSVQRFDDRTATGSLGDARHTYTAVSDATFTVEVTVTDKDGATDSRGFTVQVDGIETQLEDLVGEIGHVAELPAATKRTLVAKIEAFLAGFESERSSDKRVACNALKPFTALVAAQAAEENLPAGTAERWIADADRVHELAGC
jgi:cytochrome c